MHFRAVASMAVLAGAATATASFGSFYMASPAGLSLARRDTDGYQPNSTVCNQPGNTCAQVCGAEYAQCASTIAEETHCFKPSAGETCCMDGSGNSCQKGFFCANEPENKVKKNWCCPEGMSLEDCATKFGVKGHLQLAKPSTSSVPTPAPASDLTTTITMISTKPLVTALINSTTSAPSVAPVPTVCTTCAAQSPVNNTIATQPVYVPSPVTPHSNVTISGAASSGISSLLLVLACFVAVM